MINLVVGLAVGVLSHGLPLGEALSTYSQLTIGDGLVSQIPALITSMAAALLLSRGGATDTTADLLSRQFAANWRRHSGAGWQCVVGAGAGRRRCSVIAAVLGGFAGGSERQPPGPRQRSRWRRKTRRRTGCLA